MKYIGLNLNEHRIGYINYMIETYMNTGVYLKSDLTLVKMSVAIDVGHTRISAVIQLKHGKNFNDFINGYRVKHFIGLVIAGQHKNKTIEALAIESGFGSRNTFTTAMQKVTGMLPRDYLIDFNKKSQFIRISVPTTPHRDEELCWQSFFTA